MTTQMNSPCKGIAMLLMLLSISIESKSQYEVFQFFDGADTLEWESIQFQLSTDSSSLWQIGPPQKNLFDSAFSPENALVTDTIAPYGIGATDSVSFDAPIEQFGNWGILMIRWTQKLDMRDSLDIGRVEFRSTNTPWQSAFSNPFTYNFYGFEDENRQLIGGHEGFSGRDTTWRDIWLCYDMTYNEWQDLEVRFLFDADTLAMGDSISYDGWIMDNFMIGFTIFHTLAEEELDTYMKAYPTVTSDRVFIETQKKDHTHLIEHIEVYDMQGRMAHRVEKRPVKTFVDLSHLNDGQYLMRVKTNLQTEEFKIFIAH